MLRNLYISNDSLTGCIPATLQGMVSGWVVSDTYVVNDLNSIDLPFCPSLGRRRERA